MSAALGLVLWGSSPRMRGAHYGHMRCSLPRGIIPADAGSTHGAGGDLAEGGDHPRGCGEHILNTKGTISVDGSSPRMRGALPSILIKLVRCGDHPRGCGEHALFVERIIMRRGSSPRMRGAPPSRRAGAVSVRIIPADAGSTVSPDYPSLSGEDHPRGCGEHGYPDFIHDFNTGSSPRMRGAQAETLLDDAIMGIIPADAGSTPWPRLLVLHRQDHPRGCGEHSCSLKTH